jgi:NADH dehydrogenase FAD-containing subunit
MIPKCLPPNTGFQLIHHTTNQIYLISKSYYKIIIFIFIDVWISLCISNDIRFEMRVVILGGGFCGAFIAKQLDKLSDFETTLIDKQSYFEYAPSLHKVVSKPSLLQKLRIPFNTFLHHTTIIQSTITYVEPDRVITLHSEIPFDVLVICTGNYYPIFLDNTKNVYKLKTGHDAYAISRKIDRSNHVLIIGGGKVGVELAGEIVTKYPEKQLTIVHSKNRLLERNKPDASAFAQKFLQKRGAKIILGEKVTQHISSQFITNKGRKIHADLALWCAGIKWDTSFMQHFPDSIFSQRKQLRVDSTLQLRGFPYIFVGGDVTDIQEEKTGRKAELHARIIVTNIQKYLRGQPLIDYKQGRSPIVMSLGDWYGILEYKGVIPGRFSIGLLKKAIEWWTLHQLR